ncbi:MAG: rhodanese-like domain-containing protein [Bacteroidales bacterium]|nr:rhodanese-like domain-containing protein [Bacteroidales bacterium]
MHVHELNPKKTMVTMIIFVVVIIIGLVTLSKPRLNYAITPEETVMLVGSEEGFVYPYELEDILNKTIDTIVLVDIRNTFQFGRGHIPGAENISSVELISKENIKRLEDLKNAGQVVLLYANNLVEANGPYMLLRQIGFDNVKVLMGGYSYYKIWKDKLADSYSDDSYFMGTADYDFAEVAKSNSVATNGNSNSETKAAIVVDRKKKGKAAEGGC